MYAQTVSLTLIFAIVVCPLGCDSGFCQAADCQAAHIQIVTAEIVTAESGGAVESGGESGCCCQETTSDEEVSCPTSGSCPGSCPCPDNTCQGICGGAVVEKPVQFGDRLDGPTNRLPLPSETRALSSRGGTDERLLEVNSPPDRSPGVNFGRYLRTLHQALLC